MACSRKRSLFLRTLVFLLVLAGAGSSFFCSLGNSTDQAEAKKNSKATVSPSQAATHSPDKETRSHQVIVYITSWCPACKMTVDFLKKEGIPHEVKDIEKNPAYLDEMIRKVGGNRGVPVIDVNGKILLGFNPYIIKEMLR